MLNRMPNFVSGLPFPSKSIFRAFDKPHATGNNTAEQQKVKRFFCSKEREVRCTARINPHIRMDATMKCSPFFCRLEQS